MQQTEYETTILTVDLEFATKKLDKIAKALDGTAFLMMDEGLGVYFAAKHARDAMRLVGAERRCAAVKRALKPFSVSVSLKLDARQIPRVRIFIPTKRLEILL
jgi:hypothetical protein